MKRIIRILVLAIALVTGLSTVSAQTVQVSLIPKVPSLPSTVISYLEDPLYYFNAQFIVTGAGNEGVDIFFDMNFTHEIEQLYVRTRTGSVPMVPIHLSEGINRVTSEMMQYQFYNRLETNVNYTQSLLNVQQLPEGVYQLCLDVYLWSDRMNPNRDPICEYCTQFSICYSGSAPEMVSPMAGAQLSLDGAMVVTPSRRINFMWTPVISNCGSTNNRFKYKIKVVKVLNGQNYQDAIKLNPTVFSAEVNNKNYVVFDTLRDVKVQMQKGALYVAQVQAEQINTSRSGETFIIANDGNSQPMPFYWDHEVHNIGWTSHMNNPVVSFGETTDGTTYNIVNNIDNKDDISGTEPTDKSSRRYSYAIEDETEESEISEGVDGLTKWIGGVEEVSGLETIISEMKEQYLAGFIQDASTVASLTESYPDERQYVPTPERHYVESDGYYTVPMTDNLEVSFMPARHESLQNVSYAIELYDYIDGGVDSITAYEPLYSEVIEDVPESYSAMDSHEVISRTLEGWGSELQEGSLYYLQLSCNFTVDYWDYSIADTSFYVNYQLAEHIHDTVSREYYEQELINSNGVFFQWGDDPAAPGFTTPQWTAPVDRSADDIYDPTNYKLPASVPEVQKGTAFPVSWTSVKDVAEGDVVEYEINVYELLPDQTPEEAVAENEVIATRTLTDANEIPATDKDFFKAFKRKTYVMTLSTVVESEENAYHFENGNAALPIIFKIVK